MSYVDSLLAPGERVIHRTLRHWVVLARWVAGALVLGMLGAVMASLFGFGNWQGASVGAWAGLALMVLAALMALPAWLRWATEVYLVTDRRVIRVEGVLRKQALDSGLAKVNDVRLTQSVPGRLFGYGTLEIITASESGINRLEYLPRPLVFKKAMMEAAAGVLGAEARARDAVSDKDRPPAYRAPADRLAELDEMHRRQQLSDEEYKAKRAEILSGL